MTGAVAGTVALADRVQSGQRETVTRRIPANGTVALMDRWPQGLGFTLGCGQIAWWRPRLGVTRAWALAPVGHSRRRL